MSLFPREVKEFISLAGLPRSLNSNIYVDDPVNGNASNPGDRWTKPLLTVTAAYAKCVTDQHDAVLFVSGDTADNPSAAIAWSKDYTHLLGMSSDLPGVGQRCRIVGTAGNDLTQIITFSGNGNVVKNIQFFQGADADVDSGAAIVSGNRNHFKNVMFAGMGHATPGARAGSYSLKVSGSENLFEDCYIGLDTIVRAAANAELWLASGATRNTFRRCHFSSYSETAGKFLVKVDDGVDRWTFFDECLFTNFSVNWAASLTDAFNIGATATHNIYLRNCLFEGVTGIADVVTHIYSADPAPNAGFGLGLTPTT